MNAAGQAINCMPSPITSRTAGRRASPVSSASMAMPLACSFMRAPRRSFEAALAQPLGRDPLLARQHRGAAVQRLGGRVRPLVAEEHGVAALGVYLEVDVGEGGAAALLGLGEVH